MMENIFILPGNEQELFNRYLDNNEYGPLKERLELVRKALSTKLSPDERNKHGLNVGVHELSMERKELERKIFQMALKSFAERVCDEQRALCEQGFWQAPCGKEAEYISSAPVPDLVTDVKQYKTICRWWEKLSDTRRLKVAAMFANELGPIYGHDTETLERIYSRWFLLSLDGKQRIYHSWTTNEKQTSPCHTKARE